MKKTGIFVVCNITSVFSAEIIYKIEEEDIKKIYDATIDTLTSSGFKDVVFKADSTISIHPYKDYATTHSAYSIDDSSKTDELNFYWYGKYNKYFEYTTDKFSINHSYEELSKLKITVKNIKTAKIEYSVDAKYQTNETYTKAIDDIKKNLFKDKDFGFIILRDHYNIFVNSKYPFLSVDYDDKNNKFTVRCNSKEFEKYATEQLYYTVILKIPEDVIKNKTKEKYILQYKKEDLEKIKIEIRSTKELKYNEINSIILDNLKKRNIPSYSKNIYLLDKTSKNVSGADIAKKGNDYTFYSDDLFINEAYKNKSDELKAELNKITNILSNIPASNVVNITDINQRKNLINVLLEGMNDIIAICVKYTADNIVNTTDYNNTNGKEFITCNSFKEKMTNSFDCLAKIYVLLSTITDIEYVIGKIKDGDIDFDGSKKIFKPLSVYYDYYIDVIIKYINKVKKLFTGKALWNKYSEKLTENLTKDKILSDKYNKDFTIIFNKEDSLFKDTALNYYNTQYKVLKVKIYNEHRIQVLGNYGLRDDNNYTYSLQVRPDLSSVVTFRFLKEGVSEFSNLCSKCAYLFTIYDKNGKYIGYNLDTKIEHDYVTFNPSILQYDCLVHDYVTCLDKFKEMREDFKNREIKEINEFTGKAADFHNKYKTVLEQTEYLTLSDKMYEMEKEKEPYYLRRFRKYLIGEKDIDGKDVEGSVKYFDNFYDCNILIINEINIAAINKYNELQKAEMDEKDKETLSELQTAVENIKNEILTVINTTNDLEKIKRYSTKEEIKAELEKIVKDKVVDYDAKKAKIETIDLFTNPVAEIENVYKTKQNAIVEEKLKQEKPIKPDPSDDEEDGKGKHTGGDDNSDPTDTQNTTNESENSTNEQQPAEQKNKKYCNCNYKKK